MKRLLLIAMFLLLPAPLLAATWWRAITAEWSYTPPNEPAVDGYVLYVGTKEVCRFDGAAARTGMCDVLITAPSTQFTLTASFADGTESPPSAPFDFADTVPAPDIIKIIR